MPTYSIPKKKTPNSPLNAAQQLAQQVAAKQPPRVPEPNATPPRPGSFNKLPGSGPDVPPSTQNKPPPAETSTLRTASAVPPTGPQTQKRPPLATSAADLSKQLAQQERFGPPGIINPNQTPEVVQAGLAGGAPAKSTPTGRSGGDTFIESRNKEAKVAEGAAQEAASAAMALAEENKRRRIEAAKEEGKREIEEKAANRKREIEDNVDYDGDGTIDGKPLSQEQLINTQINKLLQGGASEEEIEKERQAMKEQMDADEARAIQSTRARAGLGGMGLTGATGALESQVMTESARSQAVTMADFERKQRQEAAERALAGIRASREEDVYGIEMELARREAGPLRQDYPEGPEGDAQFEQAKNDEENKRLEELTQEQFNSQVDPNNNWSKLEKLGWKRWRGYDAEGDEYYRYTSPSGIVFRQQTGNRDTSKADKPPPQKGPTPRPTSAPSTGRYR
jgi:hypothetical protein